MPSYPTSVNKTVTCSILHVTTHNLIYIEANITLLLKHCEQEDRGVRGVYALNRKDTQVNLTSPWCTLVTSTMCWANEAMANGRKTPKINLLRSSNNPPSSNDVTENRSEFQKPACAGNGYRKATAQIPADDDIIYLDSMTLPDQSQTEVRRLKTSLTKPKVNVNIGCWNGRMLYSIGKSAQLAREMDKYKI